MNNPYSRSMRVGQLMGANTGGMNTENMPPEVIQQLLGGGMNQREQARLAQQMEQAQALRNAPGPMGMHTGRTYVAANPLEHIAHVLRQKKAAEQMQTIGQEQNRARLAERAQIPVITDMLRNQPNRAAAGAVSNIVGSRF